MPKPKPEPPKMVLCPKCKMLVADVELAATGCPFCECSWCHTVPSQAAAIHEGPHATWCPRYQLRRRSEA
jgi:hypothetical protein